MELREYRFDEVSVNYDKKRVPLSGSQREKKKGDYPYYGAQGIIDYIDDYLFNGTFLLIAEDGENLKSKKKNIAQVVNGKFWVNNHAHIVTGNELCDTHYLCYLINSMDLSGYVTGSAQPKLSQANLNAVILSLPQIEIQKKIVDYLRKIDEKIELNMQINENLEQQALALFRHYFINFDPYGRSAPSNWSKVSLDDVCTRITDGSHYSPSDVPGAPYPMYSVKNMKTYGFDSASCKHITPEDFHKMQKSDCVPKLNDILVAKDGSYLKEIFICSEEKDEAILSSIAIFRPNTKVIIPEILLYLLKQPSVRKDVGDNFVSGSALPRIVLKDFKKYTFLLPPITEQLKIGTVLHTIRMQTKANVDEIQNLSALRDILLPQLMSGEIDVSDLTI